MHVNSIIFRYIFKECIPPLFLNIFFFTFIFLLTKILEIMNMIVNYKVGLFPVFRMIIYLMPYFLVYVIPMSIMMSVLLTFLRMSTDNEITALRSSGVSLYYLLPPVLAISGVGSLITVFITLYGVPWGRIQSKQLVIEMASSGADIALKEKTFIDSFKGVMLYVNEIDIRNKALKDIFIEDHRSKTVSAAIIAPKGRLYHDQTSSTYYILLYNGIINQVDLQDRTVHSIRFDSYELNLDISKAISDARIGTKHYKDMYLHELLTYLHQKKEKDKQYYSALIECHKKFSIPSACIFMAILAVPLGVRSKTSRRSVGLSFGLASFLVYYLLLSVGQVFGETGAYPPMIGMWAPNFILGGFGGYLLVRDAK